VIAWNNVVEAGKSGQKGNQIPVSYVKILILIVANIPLLDDEKDCPIQIVEELNLKCTELDQLPRKYLADSSKVKQFKRLTVVIDDLSQNQGLVNKITVSLLYLVEC
jgi:hypothetical protein